MSQYRNFRVLPTVRAGYVAVARHLPALVKVGWLPLASALVAVFLIQWMSWQPVEVEGGNAADDVMSQGGDDASGWAVFARDMFIFLLPMVVILPSAVRLHRSMVLGATNSALSTFSLSRVSFNVLVAYTWLWMPLALLALILSVWERFDSVPAFAIVTIPLGVPLFIAVFGWMLVYPRIAIRVVAVAVERGDVAWLDAWRASYGNTMALFMCFVLLVLPVSVVLIIVFWSEEPTGQLGQSLYSLADAVTTMLMMLLESALLSLAYLHFFSAPQSQLIENPQ